jgi:hypothetical protein
LAVLGLIWLAGLIGFVGYVIYRHTTERVLDAYALDWTATLITEHLDRHAGAWPKSWEDLAAVAEHLRQESPPAASAQPPLPPREEVERTRRRVRVNFEARWPDLLREAGDAELPPWEVVSLRSGRASRYQGRDPNAVILDHLRTRAARWSGR